MIIEGNEGDPTCGGEILQQIHPARCCSLSALHYDGLIPSRGLTWRKNGTGWGGLAHRDTVQEPAGCLESSSLSIVKTGVPWSRRDLVATKGAQSDIVCAVQPQILSVRRTPLPLYSTLSSVHVVVSLEHAHLGLQSLHSS